MKTNINKIAMVVFLLIGVSSSYGQGSFSYHYIIPPELGDKLKDVKKIAFMDFTYKGPGQKASTEEGDFNTEEELLKLMVEKQKKELLGEEEYNKLQASKNRNQNSDPLGDALSSNIISILLIPNRGKVAGPEFLIDGMRTDIYTIVDREDIDRILNEQQFQLSGVVDGQQMAEIGVLLGADAIISGNLIATSDDKRLPEKIEKVYRSEKYKDKEGKERTRSVFDYYKYIYTTQRTVTSTFALSVVSVKTGQILGSKNFTANASDSKSRSFNRTRPADSKKYPPVSELATVNSLVRRTVNSLSVSAANYIAPRFGTITLKISKVKAKEFKSKAKEAAEYLKEGRIEKAYAIYKTIYDADPYITESAFNLGMIYEATGEYDKALELYSNARETAVKNSNEKKYTAAVDRAERGVEVINQLNAIGIKLNKQYFSDEGAESLMADKVHTKGNPKKDRYSIYKEPDKNSSIIGKVPGGRDFPALKVEGNFTLIEIIGGKRGYISNEYLK